MTTQSQSSSSTTSASSANRAPYAGPERRVADRGRPVETSGGNGAHHALGPYLRDRRRNEQRSTPAHVPPVPDASTRAVGDPSTVAVERLSMSETETVESTSSEAATHHARSIELPWITAFLDDVPVSYEPIAEDLDDPSVISLGEAPGSVEDIQADAAADAPAATGENWPLDDVGARLRALAFALDEHTSHADSDSRVSPDAGDMAHVAGSDDAATPGTSLPMWSDDDFLDVMPVHTATVDAMLVESDARETHAAEWGARAIDAGDVTPHSFDVSDSELRQRELHEASIRRAAEREAAASALESVAHRVRTGEISLAGFDAALGEAAALATTLAAMLSGSR